MYPKTWFFFLAHTENYRIIFMSNKIIEHLLNSLLAVFILMGAEITVFLPKRMLQCMHSAVLNDIGW